VEALERLLRGFQCGNAVCFNLEMPFSLAAALCRRLADPRRYEPFTFESLERRMNCANGRSAIRYAFDLGANQRPVCAVS
jgi:hypothetical protein